MLLLECQEAERHLASLQEKMRRIVESLQRVTEWAQESYHDGWHFDPRGSIVVSGLWDSVTENLRYRNAMNFDELVNLGQEIKGAVNTLRELQGRKRVLGLE
jgi:hypothetical protein